MTREAQVTRNTKETQISLKLGLDGSGKSSLDTGVGFFDHMLDGFARHGLFDLDVKVKGDLQVDDHHTIEDTGIVRSKKQLETRKESAATEAAFFLWMSAWCSAQWILEDVPIFPLTESSQAKRLAICPQKW